MPRPAWLVLAAVILGRAPTADAAPRAYPAGTLIVPMDLAYQDRGLMQAYGLVFQLLRQGIPVDWAIAPDKTWHAAPCDTPGDLCPWDCAVEGSGVKCPYPTASPDFTATTAIVWGGAPGAPIGRHAYRGGPFVVDAAHRAEALAVIDAWNDPTRWPASPWAARTIAEIVTVHTATAGFTADIARELRAAPTIAVFSDGNEDIATSYLRAAGIPQSNGAEFPANRCGGGTCGPGTANPDMLTVPSIMGEMGTCDAPNRDHKNGALFTAAGVPAYCQIMSMHWNVTDRETVECDGGPCPTTQAACAGERFTYHGHEVVAEVRAFLQYPVHFFAECQAVNAYENTVPNPAWPYLDDADRNGHFLTTTGTPPACPCTDAEFQCVVGGCAGADCCLPRDPKERGAGFMIGARPPTVQVLRPEVPYNQRDGAFTTIGGSEPAYSLSAYLGSTYQNAREVVFLTGPAGPGVDDVWMTGYVDGACDIGPPVGLRGPACAGGKVSYLGGHAYGTGLPVSSHGDSQGARLFLNALFEADCVTSVGQPAIDLALEGPLTLVASALPATAAFAARYDNHAIGPALDAVMTLVAGPGVTIVDAGGGAVAGDTATWTVGAIGGVPGVAGDPAAGATRPVTLQFDGYGDYAVTLAMTYRVGLSTLSVPARAVTVRVVDREPAGDGGVGDGGGGGGGGEPAGGCCGAGGGAGSLALGAAVAAWLGARRRRWHR